MYKVMFVDDEPWAIIDIMHSTPWEDTGFIMTGYWDKPTVAFQEIIKNKPDLIFTDIRMPVWDGFELIKKCREAGSESEFIILSSYSDFLYAKQAIKASVLDYCLKPVNPAILLELLEEIRSMFDDRHTAIQPIHIEDNQDTPVIFNEILIYMQENFHHKLALTHLAGHFHFNKNYICNLFKKHAKTTFITYLTQLRIEASKKLLENSSLSLGEIAKQVGFSDSYYFSRVFKAECGCSPSLYRNRAKRKVCRQI